MNLYQVVWSESIEPTLTEEEVSEYIEMAASLYPNYSHVYPIGKPHNGRILLHGIGSKEMIDSARSWLISKGKDPKMIRVSDKDDVEYGYKRVLVSPATETQDAVYDLERVEVETIVVDVETEGTFFNEDGTEQTRTIVVKEDRDVPVVLYQVEDSVTEYLQPYVTNINGEDITITPSLNSFSGWKLPNLF